LNKSIDEVVLPEDKDTWFESVMDEYGERLTKLAYNYLKDWKQAEDVAQEVFITCYKQYNNLNQITSFKAWLYRITINRAKDVLKSSSFKKLVFNSRLVSLFSSTATSPEIILLKRSKEEFLSLCVLALPLKYREIITLYYYEGLSVDEISKLLKINRNTLKTRLKRGRDKLRTMMEGSNWYGQ
jgi:RNA polymerase sigma factor (sigma-70 family)